MIIVTAAALAAIATFTLPYVSRRVQIGALVVMLFVFTAMHWTIWEIDHKFEGVVQVEPTDLTLLTGAMSDQFAERHPEVTLPCNERGEPT
jgi:4-hydroxybenzoate polyprenyltransferase